MKHQKFLHWIDEHKNYSLEEISNTIGDADIVVLSEGEHCMKEFMTKHFDIIKHLVTTKNFNTVITETAFPESREIRNYILHNKLIDFNKCLNPMYSQWKEHRDLIEWMKTQENLYYYGNDVAGLYSDLHPAYDQIRNYFQLVDSSFADYMNLYLFPIIEELGTENAQHKYITLNNKHDFSKYCEEVLFNLDSNKDKYISKSSIGDFSYYYQVALNLQLTEQYYYNFTQWLNKDPKFIGLNGREIAMAINTEWIYNQPSTKKIIIITHNIHSKSEVQYQKFDDRLDWGFVIPAISIMKKRINAKFYTICGIYARGKCWENWSSEKKTIENIPKYKKDGLESILDQQQDSCFIDWSSCPFLNFQTTVYEDNAFMIASPKEWDGCLFFKNISPATPI